MCAQTPPPVGPPKKPPHEGRRILKKKKRMNLPPPPPNHPARIPLQQHQQNHSQGVIFPADILKTTIPFGIALALTSIAPFIFEGKSEYICVGDMFTCGCFWIYIYVHKKTKSSVGNLFQILQIPKSDYDIPTPKSSNRYIPYVSDTYKGKTYIYMEGDSSGEEKYAFMSDTTDVTSSESEYEELDINEIYPYQSPKYKTLIEVVLEPSGKNTTASGKNTTASGNNTTASGKNTPSDTQNDIQSDGIPSDTPNTPSDIPKTPSDTPPPITDEEWNQLKHDFISNMLQNTQNTEPNMLGYNVDNNTHPTPSRHTLDQKPFITSIHDRNLYTGEEYNYNVNMSTNSMDDTKYVSNNVYSGIDLINDSLNSGNQPIDIYDELLKRKENELFGTNHPKHTNTHNVTKSSNSDPIDNQLDLFHTWLDRHRDMCEKLKNDNERLAKLKEEWENETHSGNTHPSDSNKTLNTDVSIQIHMDNPKPINEFTYVDSNPNQVDDTYVDSNPDNSSMDTILEDLEKYNEPYYYDMYDDDIYYDVNDHDASTVDSNNMDVPSKVQIEMDVNTKLVKEKYPIADVWDI
ncbi:erythrocyte membrane protein 1 [Plasmodium falciparum RAJ116]|uniref:Erythrocyte membrane protein 1 n=1 Tax=Plasmodium falciparum RAJ116 TaxID=580058 RepID=A0A0L0CXQ5_PLAFA|nr:erythrocyte membrane protein 1 [Plasmodium falciparum RAJ116]